LGVGRSGRAAGGERNRGNDTMAFILGVIFFVGVVGVIDARLPWPRPQPSACSP
jgi:hypothetical protein